ALHNFVIIDPSFIETMMKMAGVSNPAAEAVSFTKGFRIVGCLYIVGNALGVLFDQKPIRSLVVDPLVCQYDTGIGICIDPGIHVAPCPGCVRCVGNLAQCDHGRWCACLGYDDDLFHDQISFNLGTTPCAFLI
ncbi:MAG: hypothetical protein AB2404_09600, partial [Planifilum fimeticola]